MKVWLKALHKGDFREIDVEPGTRVEELYKMVKDEVPHEIFMAQVDNEYVGLRYKLEKECRVELHDMGKRAANLVYISSLTMLYLAAVRRILGDVHVEIQNSLNQGMFTIIRGNPDPSPEMIAEIEAEMHRMVEDNLPIIREQTTRETALEYLRKEGRTENLRLLEAATDVQALEFYELDGFRDFYYSIMVPSTGYLKYFELVKYKRGIVLRFPLQKEPEVIPPFQEQVNLYQTFAEQTIMERIMGVSYVLDLNEKVANGEQQELILLSEALQEKKISDIADMIKAQKKRIILIAGPSSSGKTTFAKRLSIQMKINGTDCIYMGTDDYFVERCDTPLDKDGEPDYENLNAIDTDLFNRNMRDLLAGKEVDIPTFDFIHGTKVFGKRFTTLRGGQAIIIEGIHALNEQMTSLIPKEDKFKIYISPLTQLNIDEHNFISTTDERMLRRMVRDYQFRGHDARETINGWPKVRKGEDKNIFPYTDEADVLFNSYHAYEISVLKKYAEPLLEDIHPDEPEYAEARRMMDFLRFFLTIEDDTGIVNNSILREFIGGSIFVK